MKIHTTNHKNTFIEVADDCPVRAGETPAAKENSKTIAHMQFEMISKNLYKFTSDDILFFVFADRTNLKKGEYKKAREQFFSKGQPCLRASPLTKRYGWGIHFDKQGLVALVGCETAEYKKLYNDSTITKVKAMSSKKL
ncbi:MAG: hypothetical protein H7X88_01985 [Gloeobacteraceae cyanobacterium ES-bin-316]|nr:hypothetical protein [Ferruginibacter sp.]